MARRLRSFDFLGEGSQRRVPELVASHQAHHAETMRIDGIETARALGAVGHQAGFLEQRAGTVVLCIQPAG